MRHAARFLCALLFAVHGLTAPFWILCHATGPGAHDRLELAFAACCSCCESGASRPAMPGGAPACATDADDCDACHDERLEQPRIARPACPALPDDVLPVPSVLPVAFVVAPRWPACLPDHSGDPPLFLTHCNFRI